MKRTTRRRSGSSLLELLVAIVLLDLALLTLGLIGAVTARRIGEAGRRSRASLAAANRLERLATLPCAMMTGGSATLERAVTETWTAIRTGPIVELTDSIEIDGRSPEYVVVRRRATCE